MHEPRPISPDLDRHLREVSRSFYLSIRVLPEPIRGPIAIAYLLARATDTIADAGDAPVDQRRELLGRVSSAIDSGSADPHLSSALTHLAAGQSHPGEARLLTRLPEAIDVFAALADADRLDVKTVLAHIIQGQDLDIERFGDASSGQVAALPDASALHTYTYLVAGSVGEFWTDVCARHLPDFTRREVWHMRALGRSFGCGLQLVNIVRDAGEDLANGRCYFPADELSQTGLDAALIVHDPDAFMPVWQRWQQEAMDRMHDGVSYARDVESRRVRAAVALPALLGIDTLAALGAAGASALATRVKVPRQRVRNTLLRMGIRLASRAWLQSEWDNRRR